jgi:hypothetical protein
MAVADHVFLLRGVLSARAEEAGGISGAYSQLQRWDAGSLAEIDAVVQEVLSIRSSKVHKDEKSVKKVSRKTKEANKADEDVVLIGKQDESEINLETSCTYLKLGGKRDVLSSDTEEPAASLSPAPPPVLAGGGTEPCELQVILTIPYDNDEELIKTLETHISSSKDSGLPRFSAPAASRRITYLPSHRTPSAAADLVEQDQFDQLLRLRSWRADLRACIGLEMPA